MYFQNCTRNGVEKLLKYYQEELISDFKGTIIDLETIGKFDKFDDSRQYKNITPVIFGYINGVKLKIIYAENEISIELLKQEVRKLLYKLEKPLYAFNSIFEKGVLFQLNLENLINTDMKKKKKLLKY